MRTKNDWSRDLHSETGLISWADQNVMFDWTADITGTGDRSEYIVESD